MRALSAALTLILLTACGDDAPTTPDAPETAAARKQVVYYEISKR